MYTGKRQCTALNYTVLSLVCLFSLFVEFILLQCEQFIYAKNYYKFTITESIVHWAIICFVWGMVGTFLLYLSARVYRLDIIKKKQCPTVLGWIIAIVCVAVSFALKFLVWGEWKVLYDIHNSGWFQFIFQYIYYLFETLIVLLTIVFAQELGEKIFKPKFIPWGGILLSVTWGISHILSQGDILIGFSYIVYSLLYGTAYIAVKKNIYISYAAVALMFLI